MPNKSKKENAAALLTAGIPRELRGAGDVLSKLLALGLSRVEPDSLAAITEAEAKRQTPAR
jgi:hypothetical protein